MKTLFRLAFPIVFIVSCSNEKQLDISQVRSIQQLATSEFVISKTLIGTKSKSIIFRLFKLNEASFIVYTKAYVKTGVDFSNFSKANYIIQGDDIELVLPPIKVLSFDMPAENFAFDTKYSDPIKLFNRITLEDQEEIFREGELAIREDLQKLGIIEKGQEHARRGITALFKNMGYNTIMITFEDSVNIENDLNEEDSI